MENANRPLRIISRTDTTSVRQRLQAKEYALLQAVLDANDDDALDAAFCALFDFMEPDLRLVTGVPRGESEGESHGDA